MLDRQSFASIEDGELKEMLLGTWLAIALVADELAARGELDRSNLLARLTQAERSCARPDGRARAVGVIGWLFAAFGQAGADMSATLH